MLLKTMALAAQLSKIAAGGEGQRIMSFFAGTAPGFRWKFQPVRCAVRTASSWSWVRSTI
jgi:hypothetical protein